MRWHFTMYALSLAVEVAVNLRLRVCYVCIRCAFAAIVCIHIHIACYGSVDEVGVEKSKYIISFSGVSLLFLLISAYFGGNYFPNYQQ